VHTPRATNGNFIISWAEKIKLFLKCDFGAIQIKLFNTHFKQALEVRILNIDYFTDNNQFTKFKKW